MMKEELKKFICENENEYWYGCSSENMLILIDKFFDQYQPERSKREDCMNVLSLICKSCNKDVLYLDKQKNKTVSCKCGALNSMET